MGELVPTPVVVVAVASCSSATVVVVVVAIVVVMIVILVAAIIGSVIALGASINVVAGIAIIVVATASGAPTTWNESAASTHL